MPALRMLTGTEPLLKAREVEMFLVRRDSSSKHLVLCVHFPSLNESSAEVLEYTIKEEKSTNLNDHSVL
ncbi:hypothetical protein P7K49_018498 [Saguinus oedipus]|uniref:Uncharacterized protein n=1 Tax=Saguinus oedipus TaxID=9490 RepID=A0ABQ9V5J3_SAGOE|nr:hypothetical protein P7K49_018498 [Saguinus oedipus]